MGIEDLADEFVLAVAAAATPAELHDALAMMTAAMGFGCFALTHHVDIARAGPRAIRLHNYPEQWAEYYDRNALGVSDPVHRVSHLCCRSFRWSEMSKLIPLTPRDREMLLQASEQGIGDGFTVPTNVPGEASGSCSFANPVGREIDARVLRLAHYIGVVAFDGARQLWGVRSRDLKPVELTDRQRQVLLWTSRGKTDSEAGQILGISKQTVGRHVIDLNERYGVTKRTSAMVRALIDGTLTLTELLTW
jgi:DNA-binding CsgD family transcriptional regulator